jgi:hypothetical protein
VCAAGALVFTARNFVLSRRTFELAEQGQVTDRYTKATEQLGSDKIDVRIGGIYALERVAQDSPRDQQTVMEVLSAFIREHSRKQWPDDPREGRWTRPDVQAALTVVGRRNVRRDIWPIDLFAVHLIQTNLNGADLSGAYLSHANLDHTGLRRANLSGVRLNKATIQGGHLGGANLRGANLVDATLTGGNFTDADFTDATLTGATFTKANLTRARWPSSALVPEGWRLDTGSGRLEWAGVGDAPADAS